MPKDAFGNELMKPQVIPVGMTHQTPAVRNHINNVLGHNSPALTATGRPKHHRRKSASTGLPKAKRTHKRRSKKGSKGGGLVKLAKGSAAALAWGKKMHAARKKKAKAASG